MSDEWLEKIASVLGIRQGETYDLPKILTRISALKSNGYNIAVEHLNQTLADLDKILTALGMRSLTTDPYDLEKILARIEELKSRDAGQTPRTGGFCAHCGYAYGAEHPWTQARDEDGDLRPVHVKCLNLWDSVRR